MAAEINASGVFDKTIEVVNLRPTDGDSASADKAAERAQELYDDYDAVGVISLFSSLGRAIIGVTNQPEYDFVQCNVSASNPYLNDSASNTAEEPTDTEDNFYRTVASDFLQGGEMVNIAQARHGLKSASTTWMMPSEMVLKAFLQMVWVM